MIIAVPVVLLLLLLLSMAVTAPARAIAALCVLSIVLALALYLHPVGFGPDERGHWSIVDGFASSPTRMLCDDGRAHPDGSGARPGAHPCR